jgi:hypothetical protein
VARRHEKHRCELANDLAVRRPAVVFDDATFASAAASCDNRDHVAVVMKQLALAARLADGEREVLDVEQRLAAGPQETPEAFADVVLEVGAFR